MFTLVEEPFNERTDWSMLNIFFLAWACSRITQELILLSFTWPRKPDVICFIDNGSHNLAYMEFAQWRPWWQTSKKQASLSFSLSFKVASPKHSFLMWNSLMICNPSNELDWIPLRGRGRREQIEPVSLPNVLNWTELIFLHSERVQICS